MIQVPSATVDDLSTPPEAAHSVMAAWFNGWPASTVPFLTPEHFSERCDQSMWSLILELEARGVVGDHAALRQRTNSSLMFQAVDIPAYWRSILECTERADAYTMKEHAHTVCEYAQRRAMAAEAQHLHARAHNVMLPLPRDWSVDPAGGGGKSECVSLEKLLKAEYPEPRGPWPGVIPVGLTVIGARPKSGKSLLMLQVGGAVGSGGMLFGQPVGQKPVLYYALEDSPQRVQERARRMRLPADAKLDFRFDIKPLDLGGLDQVTAEIEEHGYGMVIFDTISRAMPGRDFVKDGALFGDWLGRLQSLALRLNIAIVVVLHTRKPNGMNRDPVDDVLGSTHMTAPADCVMTIYRDQGSRSTLMGRARDVDDFSLTMEMDPVTVCWQLIGKTEEVARTDNESLILEALAELGKARASEVAELIGAQRTHTSARLQKMAGRGLVCRELIEEAPYYSLPGKASPEEAAA